MKLQDFKKLIREEVRKVITEASTKDLLDRLEFASTDATATKAVVKMMLAAYDIFELQDDLKLPTATDQAAAKVIAGLLKTPAGRAKILKMLKQSYDAFELEDNLTSGGSSELTAAIESTMKNVAAKLKSTAPGVTVELQKPGDNPGSPFYIISAKFPITFINPKGRKEKVSNYSIMAMLSPSNNIWKGDLGALAGSGIAVNKETTKTAAAATDKLVSWFSKNIKKYANTTVTWDGNEYTL